MFAHEGVPRHGVHVPRSVGIRACSHDAPGCHTWCIWFVRGGQMAPWPWLICIAVEFAESGLRTAESKLSSSDFR